MKSRTLEEYKKDVFSKLNDSEKLEWMYQMSKQLCEISDYIDSQIEKKHNHPYSCGWRILNKIKKILGD